MKCGYVHFSGPQPDADYVRVTLTPRDEVKPIPGKKLLPVIRFRDAKKKPDQPGFIQGTALRDWIAKLAAHKFEYIFIGSEMNDASQWSGTPQQYFDLFTTIRDEWKQHDPATLVCDGGLQGTAILKDKIAPWLHLWSLVDRVNFHHFQDIASIEKILTSIRAHTLKKYVCSAAGVKKSVGKKVTMTAKILEMQRLGVELLIWFSGDGDDPNKNVWTLPRYLKEFNEAFARVSQ